MEWYVGSCRAVVGTDMDTFRVCGMDINDGAQVSWLGEKYCSTDEIYRVEEVDVEDELKRWLWRGE